MAAMAAVMSTRGSPFIRPPHRRLPHVVCGIRGEGWPSAAAPLLLSNRPLVWGLVVDTLRHPGVLRDGPTIRNIVDPGNWTVKGGA